MLCWRLSLHHRAEYLQLPLKFSHITLKFFNRIALIVLKTKVDIFLINLFVSLSIYLAPHPRPPLSVAPSQNTVVWPLACLVSHYLIDEPPPRIIGPATAFIHKTNKIFRQLSFNDDKQMPAPLNFPKEDLFSVGRLSCVPSVE